MSEPKRTFFASRAVVIADIFKHTVGKERLDGGDTTYSAEISEPDGESTAGGKLAVQHIGLVPANGAGTLVMGTMYQVDKRCELRSYEHVAIGLGLRWPADLPAGTLRRVINVSDGVFCCDPSGRRASARPIPGRSSTMRARPGFPPRPSRPKTPIVCSACRTARFRSACA